jgi:hypothetical protein
MSLDHPIFTDAEAALKQVEGGAALPDGPVCPHCGKHRSDQDHRHAGQGYHRLGLYNCKECRMQFSVTVGAVFEDSTIALNRCMLATFLMASSEKGMRAHQLHSMLGVTYRPLVHGPSYPRGNGTSSQLAGAGRKQIVEADTTYMRRQREEQAQVQEAKIAPDRRHGQTGPPHYH